MVGRGKGKPLLPPEAVQQRFWSYVEKSEGCWIWTGGTNADGYGGFWLSKTETSSVRRKWRASRLAWIWEHGPIPPGMFVCHKCDVPACVRPDHLFLGTNRENMRDAASKGRVCKGVSHHLAVLTPEAVRDIRRRAANGEIHFHIAKSLGINSGTVWKILNGLTWKHVPAEEPWL